MKEHAWLILKDCFSRIVAGEHNLYYDEGTEQAIDVSRVVMHEDYNGFTIVNDICILELANNLMFDEWVETDIF